MKLEGVVYCSAEGCDAHQHVGPDTMELGHLPPGWVVVRFFENNGIVVEHAFDQGNCALKWLAANTQPAEIV